MKARASKSKAIILMFGRHLSLAMLKSKKQFDVLLQNAFLRLLEFNYQRFIKRFLHFEEHADSKN